MRRTLADPRGIQCVAERQSDELDRVCFARCCLVNVSGVLLVVNKELEGRSRVVDWRACDRDKCEGTGQGLSFTTPLDPPRILLVRAGR